MTTVTVDAWASRKGLVRSRHPGCPCRLYGSWSRCRCRRQDGYCRDATLWLRDGRPALVTVDLVLDADVLRQVYFDVAAWGLAWRITACPSDPQRDRLWFTPEGHRT